MGMRGKRGKDRKSAGWFKDTVLGFYTADWVKRDLEAATPEVRLKLVGSWVEKNIKMDQSASFQLIITGLKNKVIDAKVIDNKALDAHEDDETE